MKTILDYNQILSALRQKREQIEEAILVIERLSRGEINQRSHPSAWSAQPSSSEASAASNPAPKKRTLSAAGRKRIAEAARKRWAQKRAADAAAKKASRSRKPAKAAKKRA